MMLDTDIIVAVLRNDESAIDSFNRYSKDEQILLSAITWYELMTGCGPNSKKGQLAQIVECLTDAGIVHVDDTIATLAARFNILLSAKGRNVGLADKLIAASSIVGGHTLVTRNTKHFEGIPGLKVEKW